MRGSEPPARAGAGHGVGRRGFVLGAGATAVTGAAALTGTAALAGCAVTGAPAPSAPRTHRLVVETSAAPQTGYGGEPTPAAIRALLERRTAALRTGDERAFLGDLDPSNAALVARQRMLLGNLHRIGLATVGIGSGGHFPRAASTAKGYTTEVTHVVRLTTDTGPPGVGTSEEYVYTLGQRGGAWVVLDIQPAKNARLAPWSLNELTVHRTGNVVLVGDSSVADLAAYAREAGTEARFVEKLWGTRPGFPGYVLFFTRSDANFRAWYDNRSSGWAEGITPILDYADAEGEPFTGDASAARVVISLKMIDKGGHASQERRSVLRHELVHAITSRTDQQPGASLLGGDILRWAVEGFARFAETLGQPSLQAVMHGVVRAGTRSGLFTGKPPVSGKAFYAPKTVSFNYMVSATVFEYVQRKKGQAAAVEFYDQVHNAPDLPGMPYAESGGFSGACRSVLGISGASFWQEWNRHVRSL